MIQPDDLIAFIDESKRPIRNRKTGKADLTQWHYVLAAVVVMRTDLELVRRQLSQIEADLNYQLHYHEMKSHTRRRNAIDAINQIAEWESYITETSKPIQPNAATEHRTRTAQLKRQLRYLENSGINQAIMETRTKSDAKNATLDENDLTAVDKMRDQKSLNTQFRVNHVNKNESILKIADLLASSRTDMLCAKDESIYPRITHRVIKIQESSP